MVNSRDLINEHQAELLARIAGGDILSGPEGARFRRSAYALRERGLVTTSKRGGVFTATITDRGRFYLDHDRHPGTTDTTPTPAKTPPPIDYHSDIAASTDGRLLIDLLVAAPDNTVWIQDPDEEIRIAYRRTIHAARQHGLIPNGFVVGTVQRTLHLREEYDQPTPPPDTARARYYPSHRSLHAQRTRSGHFRLDIGLAPSSPPDTWVEQGRSTLKAKIREIVAQAQAGVEDDERARQDETLRHQEWKAAEELRQAAEKIVWQDAIDHARPKAIADLRHATLLAALTAWRNARDMREICAVLNTAADTATSAGQTELAENLAAWRDDGLTLADTVDPTIDPASLGTLTHDLDPTPDDLRPHLDGWSPTAPRRDTYNSQVDRRPSRPWPAKWSQLRK